MSYIIVTPINLNNPSTEYGKKARIDYLREKEHSNSFQIPISKWDDSIYGNAEVGYYFAFVQHKEDIMEIFKIEKKIIGEKRPGYWDIEEHKTRDILILSHKIGDMKWSDFKNFNNYKENFKLRGTSRLKINKIILHEDDEDEIIIIRKK